MWVEQRRVVCWTSSRRVTGYQRTRRYVSRHLSIAKREAGEDNANVRRMEVLSQILLGDVSPQVESALGETRNLRPKSSVLLTPGLRPCASASDLIH